MKHITRRWFLKALGGLGLSSFFPAPSFASFSDESTLKTMEALTEAIMPGVKSFNINEKIITYLNSRYHTARLFTAGLKAIEKYSEKKYGKSFYSLQSEEKDAVLKWMSSLPVERWERTFFIDYRQVVLERYYTSPEAWKTLNYNGPPQPKGFMDYHLPPGREKG